MDIKRALPRPELRSVVRSFEERRAQLGSGVLTWPVAARPHQILDVHLAEPYQVRLDGGPARLSPETVVVGPQTRCRAHIHLSGETHVFNILFQPTGLNRLVGINMASLVNQDPAASDVLGKSAVALGDAVRKVDQAHFIRECRAFAVLSPSGLIGDWDNIFFPANG